MSPGRPARDDELLSRARAERADDRVVRQFQLFARRRASGGLVLLGCAILALAGTNSPWAGAYGQMLGVLEGGVVMAVLTLSTLDLFLPGGPGGVCVAIAGGVL